MLRDRNNWTAKLFDSMAWKPVVTNFTINQYLSMWKVKINLKNIYIYFIDDLTENYVDDDNNDNDS